MHAAIQEYQDIPPSVVLGVLAIDVPILLFSGRKHPWIPLMLIFGLAPFQQDMSVGGPVRFSIAEINLMLTGLLFLFRRRPMRWGPASLPIALYLGVCGASAALSWRATSLASLIQVGLYVVVAVVIFTNFGRDEEDFRPALYGLLAVGVFLSIAVIVLRSGFVLGLHKNGVGDSLASAVIVCGELSFASTRGKRRVLFSIILGILTAGLFFSLSRGAWLGACCGFAIILVMRRQFRMLFRLGVLIIPLVAICWHVLPQQVRESTTALSIESENIRLRYESLYFARDSFEESPLIGVGIGLRKEYDATNIFWLTMAETGVLGMITFFGFHGALLKMVWETQKRLARTEMLYSLAAIGGALITSKLIHGMVDHYWSRGAIMIAWASVGMATHSYCAVRRRRFLALQGAAARRAIEEPQAA